jgi:hypothetical protein
MPTYLGHKPCSHTFSKSSFARDDVARARLRLASAPYHPRCSTCSRGAWPCIRMTRWITEMGLRTYLFIFAIVRARFARAHSPTGAMSALSPYLPRSHVFPSPRLRRLTLTKLITRAHVITPWTSTYVLVAHMLLLHWS